MSKRDKERNECILNLNLIKYSVNGAIFYESVYDGFCRNKYYYRHQGKKAIIEELLNSGLTKEELSNRLRIRVDKIMKKNVRDFSFISEFNHDCVNSAGFDVIKTTIGFNNYLKGRDIGLTGGIKKGYIGIAKRLLKLGMSKEEVSQRLDISLK